MYHGEASPGFAYARVPVRRRFAGFQRVAVVAVSITRHCALDNVVIESTSLPQHGRLSTVEQIVWTAL